MRHIFITATRDFHFFNKFANPALLERRKLFVLQRRKFTESLSKNKFHRTIMAPRRAKKAAATSVAAPTVQAEAVVADSASDANEMIDNKLEKKAKSTKTAPITKAKPKNPSATKKSAVEQNEQENGGVSAAIDYESDIVPPVGGKAGAKAKNPSASKKNAKTTEQHDGADLANGQSTNGAAPDDGKKRAGKGKQKKVEPVAPVKESKAGKGKSNKKIDDEQSEQEQEPEPEPSKADKKNKKGKASKKNIESVEEAPVVDEPVSVEAKGRRGAKKVVVPEKPVESEKPVKSKAKKVETAKKSAKATKSKPKPDEEPAVADQIDNVEEQVAPTKGRKRAAPAPTAAKPEKPPAKKGKKDNAVAGVEKSTKAKANGTPSKKRKAGVKAAADSTTTESDADMVTKRKKGSKENATEKSKINPTESDLSLIDFENEKEYSLKIVSWNVAGLRALVGRNGFDYFAYEKPDIICLQVCNLN